MIQLKKNIAVKYFVLIAIYASLSMVFPMTLYAYRVFINETGKRVNPEIAVQYAWTRLKEFDFVNKKNDLKKYDKNQYVIIVRNKRYAPSEAYVFVFFPLKGDINPDLKKQKEYAQKVVHNCFCKIGF